MALLTLVTVASLQTVGIILVVALLVIPASTAYLLTERLTTMTLLSAALGALASVVGMAFSYTFNIPSGATIVLASAVLFALAFLFAPRHGLVGRSEEHTSELQSRGQLVCRLLLERKNRKSI